MSAASVRDDFPTMRKEKGVYLDSACQSLRPDSVIRAVAEYYEDCPVCSGRSVYSMADRVSVRIDETREALARFFSGEDPESFIFTRNTTEGINAVAQGIGLKKGDTVVTTDCEHNSNSVPWLMLERNRGIRRRMSASGKTGEFDIESFKSCMGGDVKMVSVCQSTNVTGCRVPLKAVTEIAHDCGALVTVDAAQGAPHIKTDLKDLDVDFYCASLHKMLGPSGMGFMYGKPECLKSLRAPYTGGGTVDMATYDNVAFTSGPGRFEAGLQDYAGIFGTKAAVEYLENVGMDFVESNDRALMRAMFDETQGLKNLSIVGPKNPDERCGVFSFNIDGLKNMDVAMMLDSLDGIMVRSGMHCAHSFYAARGIDGSVRASTYLYNNKEDISRFGKAVRNIAAKAASKRRRLFR